MAHYKDTIKTILGPSFENKATGIAKLYICDSSSSVWDFTEVVGYVSLSYNSNENTHYLHVVNKSDNSIALTQELYENFPYESSKVFFHSFEMDDCIAGLSFADTSEASVFFSAVKSHTPSHETAGAHSPSPPKKQVTAKPAPPGKPPPAAPPGRANPPPHPPGDSPKKVPPSKQPPLPPRQIEIPPPPPPEKQEEEAPAEVETPDTPTQTIATPTFAPPTKEMPSPRDASRDTKETKETKEAKEAKEKEAAKKAALKKPKGSLFTRVFASVSNAISGNDVPEGFTVSDPRGFRHESHIGWDPEHGFEIRNIPPEWRKLFQAAGVKKSELRDADTAKFVMNVIGDTIAGTSQYTPPATSEAPAPSGAPPPPPSAPPPPPPPGAKGHHPAPLPSAPAAPIASPTALKGNSTGPGRGDLLKSIQAGKELKKVEAGALPDIKSLNANQSNNLIGTLASAMANRRGAMRTDDEEEDEEETWSD